MNSAKPQFTVGDDCLIRLGYFLLGILKYRVKILIATD